MDLDYKKKSIQLTNCCIFQSFTFFLFRFTIYIDHLIWLAILPDKILTLWILWTWLITTIRTCPRHISTWCWCRGYCWWNIIISWVSIIGLTNRGRRPITTYKIQRYLLVWGLWKLLNFSARSQTDVS